MISLIIQILLFALIGIIIGVFGTLLFFRLDKGWKQILLGAGSVISAGGAGRAFISYLKVENENIALVSLVLLIGLIVSVYFSFRKICTLLKNQSGKNVIRILDIILGYEGFIKDYYENRKNDINKSIDLEEVERRKVELEKKEQYLEKLKSGIEEQKANAITINLPENSEMPITNHFVRQIPLFVNRLCRFTVNLENLTKEFISQFNGNKAHDADCLKGYFTGIGMFIANDLFGTSSEDVRTHFRILKDNQFVQYTVVLGDKLSSEKISDIPKGKSMITKSYELRKSLVASLNPQSFYDTKTQWEDFMTITYYNLSNEGEPFLSMGISVKYKEQYSEMLYFMNFYKIENYLQSYISKIDKICNIIETLK